jgi:hypothetical protein
VSKQIINTGGQGLASSDALKAALGALVAAIVVLLVFYFLDHAGKPQATSFVPSPVAIVRSA